MTTHDDVDVAAADRLAAVKPSSVIEPSDLRVTGLASELGDVAADRVLEEAAARG